MEEGISFGNSGQPSLPTSNIQNPESNPKTVPQNTSKTWDPVDAITQNMDADSRNVLIKFLKRGIPTLIFLLSFAFGIGLGTMSEISGCVRGIYGEISFLFGAVQIPLYSFPEYCFSPDIFREYIVIKPVVFLIAMIIIYFIWSYFDNKLTWKKRTGT